MSACIAGIAYAHAATSRTVRQLAAAGALESDAAVLERFGFDTVAVAEDETPYDLALAAATQVMEEGRIEPSSIDLLIYGGSPASLSFSAPADAPNAALGLCDTRRFQYPGTRLQYDLALESASVIGLDQLACTTLFGAIRLARSLCVTEGLERVLCVSSEFYPSAAGREAITNCTADAGCAVVVERGGERNRIVAARTVTKGYLWKAYAMRDEVMASYFPTAASVITRTVADAGWRPEDVDWVIPHNVSLTSWEILMRVCALPRARLWDANIARIGHTLAGDNFINLRDAVDSGAVRAGAKAILFSYGYGAHWTALAIEV
jgi:3-oxoacyl-[acyl-carrier-protein] synthase-3